MVFHCIIPGHALGGNDYLYQGYIKHLFKCDSWILLFFIPVQVLLYDEPTAGLDPIASTVVEDLIRSVHMKGENALGKPGNIASYVVVTHQHSTIRRAVDRLFFVLTCVHIMQLTRMLYSGISWWRIYFVYRLIFLYEGKIVWQGMTHEFTTSSNPIVQQVMNNGSNHFTNSKCWFYNRNSILRIFIFLTSGNSIFYLVISWLHT